VAELRGDVRHRHSPVDLDARVAVSKVMRREVPDAGRLAGAINDVVHRVRCGTNEDAAHRAIRVGVTLPVSL
jgi:hypothetical protein